MQFPASSQGDVTRDANAGTDFQWRSLKRSLFVPLFLRVSVTLFTVRPHRVVPAILRGPWLQPGNKHWRKEIQVNLTAKPSMPWLLVSKIFLLLWASRHRFTIQVVTLGNKNTSCKNVFFLTWISSLTGCWNGSRGEKGWSQHSVRTNSWVKSRNSSSLQCCWRLPTIKIHRSLSSKTRTTMFLISWGRWMPKGNKQQVWRHSDPMVHPHYQVKMWNDLYQQLLQILAVLN